MLLKEWLEELHPEALGPAQVQQCQDGNLPFLFKVCLSVYCSLESQLKLQTLCSNCFSTFSLQIFCNASTIATTTHEEALKKHRIIW